MTPERKAREGHAIERTSPKGEKFVGTCMRCGKSGLTLADANEPCDNISGMSQDDALLAALSAPQVRAEAVDDLERLREATNRKKVGQPYLVGGMPPRAIIDHAIRALDLSMMRHDMIEDLKAGRVKPAFASPPASVTGDAIHNPEHGGTWSDGGKIFEADPAPAPVDGAVEALWDNLIGKAVGEAIGALRMEHTGRAYDILVNACDIALRSTGPSRSTATDELISDSADLLDEPATCERCQGNGEIVTDWDRYKHPREGDIGDEAVAACPDCFGTGEIDAPTPPATGQSGVTEAVQLPLRPKPEWPCGNPYRPSEKHDAYSGAQMLEYGRACAEAQRALAASSSAEKVDGVTEAMVEAAQEEFRKRGYIGANEPALRAALTAAIGTPSADYFGGLVERARQAAAKASVKFPQPNYVTLKIAEEAGDGLAASAPSPPRPR